MASPTVAKIPKSFIFLVFLFCSDYLRKDWCSKWPNSIIINELVQLPQALSLHQNLITPASLKMTTKFMALESNCWPTDDLWMKWFEGRNARDAFITAAGCKKRILIFPKPKWSTIDRHKLPTNYYQYFKLKSLWFILTTGAIAIGFKRFENLNILWFPKIKSLSTKTAFLIFGKAF